MQLAVDLINQHLDQSTSVAILTDRQTLCMALLGSYPDLDTLRPSTNNMLVLSHIQWIPAHYDIRVTSWRIRLPNSPPPTLPS